jgi:hypothetical protein
MWLPNNYRNKARKVTGREERKNKDWIVWIRPNNRERAL